MSKLYPGRSAFGRQEEKRKNGQYPKLENGSTFSEGIWELNLRFRFRIMCSRGFSHPRKERRCFAEARKIKRTPSSVRLVIEAENHSSSPVATSNWSI